MIPDLLKNILIVPEIVEAIDRLGLPTEGYDPWGFSAEQSKLLYSLGVPIYRYFRPIVRGTENIPKGRALIIGNHSGQLPFDGIVVALSTLLEADPPRLLRPLAERWVPTLPVINEVFSRAGVALGDPINGRNLLEAENAILVFPEGARGLGKTWDNRYQLENFGRGFVRLALQTNTPIVPFAIVGAEESIVSVHNAKTLANLLGFPYFPVPALLPLLGPLAYLPLPTRFYLSYGEPIYLEGPFDDEDSEIDKKVMVVKNKVQTMIDEGLALRQSVFE